MINKSRPRRLKKIKYKNKYNMKTNNKYSVFI